MADPRERAFIKRDFINMIVTHFKCKCDVSQTVRDYIQKYPHSPRPDEQLILNLEKSLRETGSIFTYNMLDEENDVPRSSKRLKV